MIEKYPESFFRGLSPNNVHQDGFLMPESFHIDDGKASGRDDGFDEISITWNDEEAAFEVIASQINTRTAEIQFSAGISIIQTKEFERQMKPQMMANNVDYERRPTSNNKYHGNILVRADLRKDIKNMIKGQFALLAQDCILPNPYAKVAASNQG